MDTYILILKVSGGRRFRKALQTHYIFEIKDIIPIQVYVTDWGSLVPENSIESVCTN